MPRWEIYDFRLTRPNEVSILCASGLRRQLQLSSRENIAFVAHLDLLQLVSAARQPGAQIMTSPTQDEVTKSTQDAVTEPKSKVTPESNDNHESQDSNQSDSPNEQNDKNVTLESGESEAARKARERMEKFKALKARAVSSWSESIWFTTVSDSE